MPAVKEEHSGNREAARTVERVDVWDRRRPRRVGMRRRLGRVERAVARTNARHTSRPSKNVLEMIAVVTATAITATASTALGRFRSARTLGAASTTLRFHAPPLAFN